MVKLNSGDFVLRVILFFVFSLAFALLGSASVQAQGKFFSTPSRGGAEGARQNAQLSAFGSELQRMNFCTGAGLIFAPTHPSADANGCTHAAGSRELAGGLTVGADAQVSGSISVGADLSAPAGSLTVGGDAELTGSVEIGGSLAVAGGIQLGNQTLCDSAHEGTLRYVSSQKTVLLCDGASWIELGAAPATGGAFNPVTNAALSTTVTSNGIGLSGFFGTRTATVTNGATIIVNGMPQGSSAEVKAGDTIALRMTSHGTYGATKSTTFSVSSLSTGWTVTTGTVSYSPWSTWGSCSESCGGGTQTKTRTCEFSAGGTVSCADCGGDCSESQECNTQTCTCAGGTFTFGNNIWCGNYFYGTSTEVIAPNQGVGTRRSFTCHFHNHCDGSAPANSWPTVQIECQSDGLWHKVSGDTCRASGHTGFIVGW